MRNLYVVTTGVQPGTGALVATVRRNGVDTAVTLTIAAGAAMVPAAGIRRANRR